MLVMNSLVIGQEKDMRFVQKIIGSHGIGEYI